MNPIPVILNGRYATLKPMHETHVEDLWAVAQDPAIWEFNPSPVRNIESMRQYVLYALSQQNEKKQLPFVISENKSGKIIGSTRFYDISIQHKGLSIGYTWLSPAFWRTSINTDCKFLLLSHAFDTLSAIRVQLKTDLRNIRSQNAIKRIGAKQEGIFRKHMILDSGLFRDSMFFSIIDDDWQSVKMDLGKKLESPDVS